MLTTVLLRLKLPSLSPLLITAVATATDALCNEAANGQVDLTVAGGTAPYTFLWSNGATTEDLTDSDCRYLLGDRY